ncbi:MAG: glycoside hydrolase family 2 [Acidobacteriaceae bacterium]
MFFDLLGSGFCSTFSRVGMGLLMLVIGTNAGGGQSPTPDAAYGPYSAEFLQAGPGLTKPLTAQDVLLDPGSNWTLDGWMRPTRPLTGDSVLAGVGDLSMASSKAIGMSEGKLALYSGRSVVSRSSVVLEPGKWHFVVMTVAGEALHLYCDGVEVAHGVAPEQAMMPILQLAPYGLPTSAAEHFSGQEAEFKLLSRAISAAEVAHFYEITPNFELDQFEQAAEQWPVQTRGQAGMRGPQDPRLLPHSRTALRPPEEEPLPKRSSELAATGTNEWLLRGGWKVQAAPEVTKEPSSIASKVFRTDGWMDAVVPGTVLTTMIARGKYPDPDYGLNNLAIPESLNRQDYWYRKEFPTPKLGSGHRLTLTFEGINYAASVWLNGKHLGEIRGAFKRGMFDVTGALKRDATNVLAVRVSPPPHPGIPHEQSIKGGPGENGGIGAIDGPTFFATEGWDWIPGIRDRNTGIWQDVTLRAEGDVGIGDIQVVTRLPHHDVKEADVEIDVPVVCRGSGSTKTDIIASFDDVRVTKSVTLQAGETVIRLHSADYPQLIVQHPKLWWPNGYGRPDLHQLKVQVRVGSTLSSEKQVRFGMREISYELSLLDKGGTLRRVEFSPSEAKGKAVVDQSHGGLRKLPAGWVASIVPGEEVSPSLLPLTDTRTEPYLVIRVNGVRIACKGGNWGMDDSRKRVSREHLEPYFRLHRDANLNIIRNWMGQDTEETFYDLADEYGLLIWNDFWESTQDYNLEPADAELFLANAKDTIRRFRNHPSIAVWCGRNEGVPAPVINEGLGNLVREEDGTRYYSASSNQVNLQTSGPYSYKPPVKFFTTLDRGFSVEMGTPSMPTLESFQHWTAPADQWPISDAWAYHDWHQSGNGDVAPFMLELTTEFGEASSLEDFERKAQMLNYVNHRAIFEGMNAHLWNPNSGRLLWMTQPAWPSTMWQILSSDYDTQASFYGVKSAAEPVHVQMDLPDLHVAVVNSSQDTITGATVHAIAQLGDGTKVFEHESPVTLQPGTVADVFPIDVNASAASGVAYIELQLRDAAGSVLSRNFYWYSSDSAGYRQMNDLPKVELTASLDSVTAAGGESHAIVELNNPGRAVALATKLTLVDSKGERILPAYYSDNYVSLLPGESRRIRIDYPAQQGGEPNVKIRGWNVTPKSASRNSSR